MLKKGHGDWAKVAIKIAEKLVKYIRSMMRAMVSLFVGQVP